MHLVPSFRSFFGSSTILVAVHWQCRPQVFLLCTGTVGLRSDEKVKWLNNLVERNRFLSKNFWCFLHTKQSCCAQSISFKKLLEFSAIMSSRCQLTYPSEIINCTKHLCYDRCVRALAQSIIRTSWKMQMGICSKMLQQYEEICRCACT